MKEEAIKKLIEEMEIRAISFENARGLSEEVDAAYGYWDGKRSEAAFVVEKLKLILGDGE